jgi:hypothetical protein
MWRVEAVQRRKEGENMKCLKDSKKDFSLNVDACIKCDKVIDCLMRLYDEPLPTLVLYSSDLLERENRRA